jgi:hypothetical protein
MMKNKNCFYCQSLGFFDAWGKCAFCGKRDNNQENPLYLTNYQGKKAFFCCQCAFGGNFHPAKPKKPRKKSTDRTISEKIPPKRVDTAKASK